LYAGAETKTITLKILGAKLKKVYLSGRPGFVYMCFNNTFLLSCSSVVTTDGAGAKLYKNL